MNQTAPPDSDFRSGTIPNSLRQFFRALFAAPNHLESRIYAEVQRGFLYFSVAGFLIYAAFAYLDVSNGFWRSAWIRFSVIFLCLTAFVLVYSRALVGWWKLASSMFFGVVFLEIEIELNPEDMKLYDPLNWVSFPIFMFVSAFFLPIRPAQYSAAWLLTYLYFFARGHFSPSGPIKEPATADLVYNAFLQIGSFLLLSTMVNRYWFRLRIRDHQFSEELQRLTDAKIASEKVRMELERELSVRRERERIVADIHDHVGGRLTDLALRVKRASADGTDLSEAISAVMHALRSRLIEMEDQGLLDVDFFSGLQIILLRRYSAAGRTIRFEADAAARQHPALLEKSKRDALLSACIENATNDLKYGCGESHWIFRALDTGDFQFQMHSETQEEHLDKEHGTGIGNRSIESRVAGAGGVMERTLHNGKFSISIRFPGA